MKRLVSLSALLAGAWLLAGAQPLGQQSPPTPPSPAVRWQRAVDAWEAGAYPAALDDLRALMKSPAAPEYLDRVALLTGELFTTTELTTDGRNPKFAASGEYASYETGPTTAPLTRIVHIGATVQTVADLPSTAIAFNRAGTRVAWRRTAAGGDLRSSQIVVRDLATGADRVVVPAGLAKGPLYWSGDDQAVLFVGADDDATRTDIYGAREGAEPVRLTDQPGFKINPQIDPQGRALVYQTTAQSPFAPGGGRGTGGGGGRGGGAAGVTFVVVNLTTKTTRPIAGLSLTMSENGGTLAWIKRDGDTSTLLMSPTLADAAAPPITVRTGRDRLDAPALSPDGTLVAYQLMTNTDWEIYVSDAAGVHRRVTRDIQHDVLPHFLTNTTLLGMMGEPRHRRSQLYDLTAGTRTRLFTNNTIRTISPEYIWLPSADGKRLLVQAERDGDTVSVERGVYVVDLARKVSVADVQTRLDRQATDENDLRVRMTAAFKPLDDTVRRALAKGALNRVYDYEKTLFDFDSKYVSQPGNAKAIDYLEKTYRSFGYAPDVQWFSPQQAQGNRTGNIVSIKRGTENPDLIYVVSSHFDSVVVGPGADDDTSGTAALLETARMLADVPLPATVVFASFTGEEAGLLGSREFVRRAAEAKWNIVGALNNDMIGWAAESARMDNTIRYSNAGIKDIQHGAAFLFTNLITYDAKYYKSTDAQAFYDGWGDIVGGIGSYPVLANPNYHQPTDFIETLNFRQILETSKVTAATLIYLASSPSRIKDLKATRSASGVEVDWAPSLEKGIKNYVVTYGPAGSPGKAARLVVTAPRATLPAVPAGTEVSVKAVNLRGLEGWDWARTVIQ